MRTKLDYILHKNGSEILFEDEAVLVIDKPAGLLVLPDRFDKTLVNLYDLLKEALGAIFIVHRIDRETSGVVLFARTAESHASLNAAFEQRHIEKYYRAIVVGSPSAQSGTIDLPIGENSHGPRKMKIDNQNGKEAITAYTVLEKFDQYAYLEARPRTGRTHQIRVHLNAIGLPILSDPLYGSSGRLFLSKLKRNYKSNGEEKPLIARTALHAFSLTFVHPGTGEKMSIETPLPKDMSMVLKVLRKYQGSRRAGGSSTLIDSDTEER
ncbi:MAG: RluA family pseudouridine synthase [Ignavibacteriae bacterium]|nr:MAG: RluA family pseudouridine synthase [Ignavibacteriota bacterium]